MFKRYAKCIALVCFALLTAQVALAQKNFRPGYVVRLNGDTLRGEIDVRSEYRMAQTCFFRVGAEASRYAANELKAYGLRGGLRYEAYQLPAAPAATTTVPGLLFLQVLVQGKAKLYSYTSEDGHLYYFFRTTGASVIELVQTTQTVKVGDLPMQEQTYPFRRVLSQAFSDCIAVQPMLVHAELKESRLLAIFGQYNTCDPKQGATAGFEVRRKNKIRLGLVGGVQSAVSTLGDEGLVDLKSNLRPVVGLGILLNPSSFNSKLGIRLEALYQTQLHEGEYYRNNGTVAALTSRRNAHILLKTVRIPFMLRYTMLTGKLRPYLQVGGEVALLLDNKQAIIVTEDQNLNGTYTTTNVLIEMRNQGVGVVGGVGLLIAAGSVGEAQLEVRYNQLDASSEAIGRLSGATTLSFLLGFTFGR